MRVVIAPDKFKGSLSASSVAEAISEGLKARYPDVETLQIPIADGGEGTIDAAASAGFARKTVQVSGPTGQIVDAEFALRAQTAVIEMAQASGLAVLPGGILQPLRASSRGTGELILAALDAGASEIILGLGGSASTDAGAGMLAALGAKLLDAQGAELADGGGALVNLGLVDLSGLDPRLRQTRFILASDVQSPLLGEHGAATVFGPQKGAGPADVDQLEAALSTFAHSLDVALSKTEVAGAEGQASAPGAGAAGGVGFAALAALGAIRRPGIDVVLELVGLDSAAKEADAIITGEGSLDRQSLAGKAPLGVARAARNAGIPAYVLCGRLELPTGEVLNAGFVQCLTLSTIEPDPERSIANAYTLLSQLASRLEITPVAGASANAQP